MYREELARRRFFEYCIYMDKDFFTKRPFMRRIADAFQELHDQYVKGKAITVAVSMPPRAGKSYITSLFCTWWLGKHPELSVMRNSGVASLFIKFSYDCRAILKDTKFKAVFPDVMLSDDKQNLHGWNTNKSKQVGYFGNGVGGSIIGFGANIAITDDLYKDLSDAMSEDVRAKVDMWKQSAHNSRMETNCPEIFIGTRWSKHDEIGKAIASGKIDIEVTIPAMNVNEDGSLSSFCENVKTTAEYLKVKLETDAPIWDAEYMQEPGEVKGSLFPATDLKYFKLFKFDAEYKYLPVDTADTGGDNMSAPSCYLYNGVIYVVDVMYNTYGTDITIPEISELLIKERFNHSEIEGNSGWVLFGKAVRERVSDRGSDCVIRITKATTNKHVRIMAQAAFIRNHFCFLPESEWSPQYRKFMQVLTAYMRDGSSKADDAPDSLVMAAVYFLKNFPDLWK